MSEDTKELLEDFRSYVEGDQELQGLESNLDPLPADEVREVLDDHGDELAELNPARQALLESLVDGGDLEDQGPGDGPDGPDPGW